MTRQKHLKSRVRARMAKTGERYAAARSNVISAGGSAVSPGKSTPPDASSERGLGPAGIHPETAALRQLLWAAGVRDTRTGAPLSEELILAIGGGLGIGVFQFVYEKDDFSSFYLAGRHRWEDGLAFIRGACERLGIASEMREASSPRAGERILVEALDSGGPVIAWLDMAELGTRALPSQYAGGAYHVVTVLAHSGGRATLADLAGVPVEVDAEVLLRARGRIRKDRYRVLWLAGSVPSAAARTTRLADALRGGLRDGVRALAAEKRANFGLKALSTWADRLTGSGKDSWAVAFPRGRRSWLGLRSITEYVEHYQTGGGLLRPMFSRALSQAADLLRQAELQEPAERYAQLGRGWSGLAEAALPGSEPRLAEARELLRRKDERYRAKGAGATAELAAIWARLDEIGSEVAEDFPLSEAQMKEHLGELASQVRALYDGEEAALAAIARAVASES
jgi:hypothetical protein